MPKPIIQHVSDTALWVAVYRANESERSDALFKDPFARMLAGNQGEEIERQMGLSKYTGWSVVMRTRIIDDYLSTLFKEGVDLVLNLGAGLDTRPYRLENLPASLQWIEVDFPHMIQFKKEKLSQEKPRCHLEQVSLDLSHREHRKKFLKEISTRSKNILVLTEGVIPYLSNEEVAELSEDLQAESSIRFWILDYFTPKMAPYLKNRKRQKQMKNAPFKFMVDDWHSFFAQKGWKEQQLRYYSVESVRLGRPIPMPAWVRIFTRFIPKEKLMEGAKFAGYALLRREAS